MTQQALENMSSLVAVTRESREDETYIWLVWCDERLVAEVYSRELALTIARAIAMET